MEIANCRTPKEVFSAFSKELDDMNDKRERLVRASRDITQASKKLIFMLHRALPETKDEIIRKATKEHRRITEMMASRVAKELTQVEAGRYRRVYSPCVQEYVEASLFLHFLEHGTLLSMSELEKRIHSACEAIECAPLMVELSDFILGAADIAGELNRVVIGAAGRGDLQTVMTIRDFLLLCLKPLLYSVPFHRGDVRMGNDMDMKRKTYKMSVAKVEKACFDLAIRRAEFPDRPVASGTVRSREADTEVGGEPSKRRRPAIPQ